MSVLYIKGKDGKFVPIFTVKGADGSNGIDGAGIEEIKYKLSEGLVDTYEITYTDDRTPTYFTVTNGKAGKDGETPEITIGDNGNWYIDGKDTNVKAQGEDGFSPTVEIFEITGGTRVAITDKTETHEFDVLDGNDGDDGKSAYEIWLDNGHEGTEEDFLNWLKGKDASSDLNIENGSGDGAIQQKVADSIKNQALGDNSVAFGRKTISYQYGCFGGGGSCIAGRTEKEFGLWVQKYQAFDTKAEAKADHIFHYNSSEPNASYVTFDGYNDENGDPIHYDYKRYESYAVAMGDMSVAKGRGCFAMGVGSKVLDGYGAFSIGANSTVETDDLQSSGALGDTNTVDGSCSYAIGTGNKLYGNFIHAIGWKNTLGYGVKSATLYAFGRENTIIGTYNYAFGVNNNVSGTYNYSIGGVPSNVNSGNTVSGTYNYAIGYKNIVEGSDRNYVFGDNNSVKGRVSAATGISNSTNGTGKFVYGVGLKAEGNNRKVVVGCYNKELNWTNTNHTDGRGAYSVFEVGDGYDNGTRFNVLQIYKNYKDAFGPVADKNGNQATYTAEFDTNLSINGNATVGSTNDRKSLTVNGPLILGDAPTKPNHAVRNTDLDSGLSKKVSKMETTSNDKYAYLYAHQSGIDFRIEATPEVSADQVVRRDAAGKFLLPSESGTSYAASEEYVDKKIKYLEIPGFVAYEHKVITKRSSDIYHILSARGTYFNQAGGVQSHIGYFISMQCENSVLAQPIGINNVALWGNTIYFSRYNYEIGYSTREALDFNYIDTIKYYSVKNLATGVEEILIDIKE